MISLQGDELREFAARAEAHICNELNEIRKFRPKHPIYIAFYLDVILLAEMLQFPDRDFLSGACATGALISLYLLATSWKREVKLKAV